MTDEQQNNQEPSQKPDYIRSTKSTGEPKSNDGISTTPAGKQEPAKKADDGTSKTLTAYAYKKKRSSKYSSKEIFQVRFLLESL